MLLSRLRWLMAVAIGVVIMVAVWFSPNPENPRTAREPYRPSVQVDSSAAAHASPDADWDSRLALYRAARDVLITRTQQGPTREAALASLRRQYFKPDEVPRVEVLDLEEDANPRLPPQAEGAEQNSTK